MAPPKPPMLQTGPEKVQTETYFALSAEDGRRLTSQIWFHRRPIKRLTAGCVTLGSLENRALRSPEKEKEDSWPPLQLLSGLLRLSIYRRAIVIMDVPANLRRRLRRDVAREWGGGGAGRESLGRGSSMA